MSNPSNQLKVIKRKISSLKSDDPRLSRLLLRREKLQHQIRAQFMLQR